RNHTITFYQYPLPFYEVTKDFRKSIWTVLFENFKTYPKEVLGILKNFRPGYKEAILEILEFDLSFILPFIKDNLDPTSFEHIHFIHDLVSMLNREKLADKSYQNLKAKFNSKEYEYFRKLDWNTLRGKQDYDFEKYEDFQKLKEQDVRASFLFKSETEFAALHKAIKNTLSLEGNNGWGIEQSLNIIAEENFLQNDELGFKLLISILDNYPTGVNPLHKIVKVIVTKSPQWAFRLWNLISNWNHEYRLYWQLSFFDYLPIEFANYFYQTALLETIKSVDIGFYLRFESVEKVIPITSDKFKDIVGRYIMTLPIINSLFRYKEKNIIEEILQIVYNKIEAQNLRINLSYHFFEKYSAMLADNFELLKKSYIQQEKKVSNHFDLQHEGLKALLQINPNFLLEYIDSFYTDKENRHSRNTHNQLSFVWDLEHSNEFIRKAVILIIENNYYIGIGEHPLIIFFRNLNEEQKVKAKAFILRFISEYHADDKKMNPVFDVLRHTLKEFFEEAFLHYLSLNTDIDNLKKIWWRGNGGTYSGDVIIGDIHAKEWQNILAMVVKSKNQLDLIPIKTYIKKQIEYELKSGEEERKRKFINPDGW